MRHIAFKSYQKAQESGKRAEYLSNTAKFFQTVEIVLRPVMKTQTAAAFAIGCILYPQSRPYPGRVVTPG